MVLLWYRDVCITLHIVKIDRNKYGFAASCFTRAILLGVSRISLRSNITRRKANITKKLLEKSQGVFSGAASQI